MMSAVEIFKASERWRTQEVNGERWVLACAWSVGASPEARKFVNIAVVALKVKCKFTDGNFTHRIHGYFIP